MLKFESLKRWRIIAAALLFTLGGCSALGLAYKQADGLAYWWLDGYLDFDAEQSTQTRQAITRWFEWHRRHELPEYAALLQRAADEVVADTTPAQACRWFEQARQRLGTGIERSLPEAQAIAATFDDEQFARLERKQAENNDEFRDDFLQRDPQARQRAALKRALERAEQLYGRLGGPQKDRIAKAVAASPFDPQRWLTERQRRQKDLLRTLRQLKADAPTASTGDGVALRGYWQRVLHSPDEAYERYQQRLDAYNCDFGAQVHNATTAEQRGVAQRRLGDWANELRSLVPKP